MKERRIQFAQLDHAPSFGSTAVGIELIENMAQQVYNYAFPELRVRIASHLERIWERAALSLANLNILCVKG